MGTILGTDEDFDIQAIEDDGSQGSPARATYGIDSRPYLLFRERRSEVFARVWGTRGPEVVEIQPERWPQFCVDVTSSAMGALVAASVAIELGRVLGSSIEDSETRFTEQLDVSPETLIERIRLVTNDVVSLEDRIVCFARQLNVPGAFVA